MNTISPWRFFLIITILLVIANTLFIDLVWWQDRSAIDKLTAKSDQLSIILKKVVESTPGSPSPEYTYDQVVSQERQACGPICERVIEQKVAAALNSGAVPGSSITPKPTQPAKQTSVVTTTTTKSGTYYIPLSGTGSTTKLDWVDIPTTQLGIDWSEYGQNFTVTWDAYAKVYQGNGLVKIRLFDQTHGIAVSNSEVETGSQTSVHLVSGELPVWSGNNTYIVQVKTLTGYEGFFESGRIKVVVK